VFGKWLGKQCGLLDTNPFAGIKPPRCDDPDKRIIASDELAELFAWLNDRWHNWRLPIVYLEVASYTGWRATEIASLREEDLLPDGHLRVSATSSKTRKAKYGWLPADLYADLKSCAVDGSAFGKFAGELQRRLLVVRRQPGHAARVKSEFSPDRLVGWLQDELQRFNDAKAKEAAAADPPGAWEPFTLHNFRDTVITDSQAAGMSEKETGLMVGAGVEVMRKHYDKFNGQRIAKQSVELRLRAAAADPAAHSLRAACARAENNALDTTPNLSQTQVG
jgi:integrase